MKFKSLAVEAEFRSVSVLLQQMADALDRMSLSVAGQELIITRVKEHVCGDSGVHEDHRAFDARSEFEGGHLYTDNQVKKLVEYMNETYPRNDSHPTCIHHSFNGGPFHLHVQLAIGTKTYEPSTYQLGPKDQE